MSKGAALVTKLVWAFHHVLQGFKSGSQPFLRVIPTLLSFLTLSMVPHLKKPQCQTNMEDEMQPTGELLFIGIVEKQLPTATKHWVSVEPLYFVNVILSPPVFLLFFHYMSCHAGKHTKYSRTLQAEGLCKQQDIQHELGTRGHHTAEKTEVLKEPLWRGVKMSKAIHCKSIVCASHVCFFSGFWLCGTLQDGSLSCSS